MKAQFILNLRDTRRPQNIGNKAQRLLFLIRQGFQTAETWVCTSDAYVRYLADDLEIIQAIEAEIEKIDLRRRYAVRSSANVEDSRDFSFAGQFKSVTNVLGASELLQAIWSVWATTRSPGVQAYLTRHGIEPGQLRMAVIIQEMVQPVVSGVSFSKNPMTGLDQVVVEAVEGSGEALVQEGVTPQRWIASSRGEWIARPDRESIDPTLIGQVAGQTRAIARAFGSDVDLEWVYDGQAVYWLQLREITTLKNVTVYSNHIAKEVLPGMIKPLVWSINVPLVNSQWVKIFTELVGENQIDPYSLARPFYYRTYFNMGTIGQILETLGLPPESIEMMMGIPGSKSEKMHFKPSRKTLRHLPRMLHFVIDKLTIAQRFQAFSSAAKERYRAFRFDAANGLNEHELLAAIKDLYELTQATAYYNVVVPLLMLIYNSVLKSQLRKVGVDFESFDLTRGMPELEQFDPNIHLLRLRRHYCQLDESLQKKIRDCNYEEFRQLVGIGEFQQEVENFIGQFGHLSDSGNDFSSVPWREKPDLILGMITSVAPRDERPGQKTCFDELELPLARRLLLTPIYHRARQFRLYREEISSLYTFGYGLFRPYLLALGGHFVRRGILTSPDDIFYLYLHEVESIVEQGDGRCDYTSAIAARKCEMEAYRNIAVPGIIYGDQAPPVEAHPGDRLMGIPTSRGYYTGPIKVIKGIQEFHKLEEGDILAIPYSDVGWTPLFAKAGAVIAESGGILSHSSIVAREYNIPAVVSVTGACSLADNLIVTVDGYKGEVTVHKP